MIWSASAKRPPGDRTGSRRRRTRLVPTCAETRMKAATTDLIHGVRDLRQQRRVAKAGATDQGADLHAGGYRRERGEAATSIPRFPCGSLPSKRKMR